MIEKHLGESIDIHGGGQDLIFPHHENEIAQGTCAHKGKAYCQHWVHNGFVTDMITEYRPSLMARYAEKFARVTSLFEPAADGRRLATGSCFDSYGAEWGCVLTSSTLHSCDSERIDPLVEARRRLRP